MTGKPLSIRDVQSTAAQLAEAPADVLVVDERLQVGDVIYGRDTVTQDDLDGEVFYDEGTYIVEIVGPDGWTVGDSARGLTFVQADRLTKDTAGLPEGCRFLVRKESRGA